VDAVLLRSLPYRDPDRLVRIFFNEPGVGLRDVTFSKPELDDLQTRAGVFEDVTPIFEGTENLTGAKQPERLEAVNGSFSYFSMLGVVPQIGRLFGPQDFVLGFAPVIVISDGLWRRAYGADPNVLGRTLRIDNDPYTIIGVLPRGFRHPGPTVSGDVEAFGAGGFSADPFPPPIRGTRILVSGIGRLKPGLTLAQAQARLTAMAAQLRHDFPADSPPRAQWTIEIQPLQETLVGKVRPMLLVLLGAVILIVFIASLNICGRTIVVEQQVMKDCPRIKKKLKTDASYREIDLHPEIANYINKYIIGKSGLILRTKNGTPYLYGNLADDWLDQRLAKLGLYEAGMGWHSFKRFRNSWLRAPAQRCQEDLRKFWLAHKPKDMGELYSALKEDLPTRLAEAERVGYGFALPSEVVPNVPRKGLFVVTRKIPATGILINRMTETGGV
ncbi:MAG: ABC transporter permease, partial [Candidatus Acidiferrales bacterium]